MTKSNPLEDLRNQHRARRRRDLAARHAADAASRAMGNPGARVLPHTRAAAAVWAELEGAVEEWEQARRDAPPVWTLRVGRLIVSHRRVYGAEPWLEDATSHVTTIDDDLDPGDPFREVLEVANGYSLRLPGGRHALVVTVVDWTPPSLRWSTSWRRTARNRAAGVDNTPSPTGRAVGDFAAMAAGDGHPLTTSGRDPRQPMNPWPR